ncbi:MAG: endolytic transglycosylase MltG [Bacillota bacterium]|nr:endolytic transglycosylase MltG [Bacillota bacterium]
MSEISIKKHSRLRPAIWLALLFLIVAILMGYNYLNRQYEPVDPADHRPIDVRIPANSTAREIAIQLEEAGLVHSANAFLSYCRKEGLDSQLKAGHYIFKRSQSVSEIAGDIARGAVVTQSITIPEGYTVDQIGRLFVKQGLFTEAEWQEALEADYSFAFLEGVSPQADHALEGFLFPDTYVIPEDITTQEMIQHMLATFDHLWQEKLAAAADENNLTINETVTLASLIEREAQVGSEREVISGVIHNRLARGMLLQIDATVLYCLPNHKEVVTYADLEIDNPYNTYKYLGLPPGPIANPGLASLEAALHPQEHNYLYYVARGDGSHHFSVTYEEHLRAKGRYID